MLPTPSADHPSRQWAPFACRWRLEGRAAASVQVSGEVDIATAGRLTDVLCEALGFARLIVLDLHEMTFMDSTGLHVILDASARARTQGGRIVLAGASQQVEALLDITGARAHLQLLEARHPGSAPSRVEQVVRNGWTPFDNSVNDRVLTGRVMAVSETQLWMQAADGTITGRGHRQRTDFPFRPGARSISTPTTPVP